MHPVTRFDRLEELRSTLRAKCVEDYDYFVERVFGHAVRPEQYVELWNEVVEGKRITSQVLLSETFHWLFGDLVGREERAA